MIAKPSPFSALFWFCLLALRLAGGGVGDNASATPVFGPFHASARGGGPGHAGWFEGAPPTEPPAAWSISAWVRPGDAIRSRTLVAGFGDGLDFSGAERFFAADEKGWFFFLGATPGVSWNDSPACYDCPSVEELNGGRLDTRAPAVPGRWQHLAATYDGATLRLFVDGTENAVLKVRLARAAMQTRVAPPPPWDDGACFTGKVAGFTVLPATLSAAELSALAKNAPRFDALAFTAAPDGPTPASRRDIYRGHRSSLNPQDPKTIPGPLPVVNVVRTPKLTTQPAPVVNASGDLVLDRGWEMAEATLVSAAPERLSMPGFDTRSWYDATVPGTVLTTLVQQGVYPDPTHGLNNLLIPDDLSRKSWWYRVQFTAPQDWKGREVNLTFKGINYHAKAWLNGRPLGEITGAFLRGRYDVAPLLRADGANVLAVRVWPQPHNGAPHEESTEAGIGPNGGDGTLDGPTFFCSEGWDWIPTIRDRNTGIWQDVVLHPSGPVALGDFNVVTRLPRLPDLTRAEVTIETEARNLTDRAQHITVEGRLGDVAFTRPVTLAPGETATVRFTPEEFPQLVLAHPQLWWPNGYGPPTLHPLSFRITGPKGAAYDTGAHRVGLRTVSSEYNPQLTVLVNGRRIFCMGGNWGLDDALKRIDRARLEPYFRLHREANLTMIRNWCGQSTSEDFYRLADEYGLLVYNDFWLATDPTDIPAADAAVFMANAADTVKRFRHHASIALWSGRNEGWPPSWLFQPLADLLERLDGTRTFVPSSWTEPVSGAGPYHYFGPQAYFEIAKVKPFNTELGVDSVPTADALRAMLAPDTRWPLGDAWKYHDSHIVKWAGAHRYFDALKSDYGESTGLEDLSRRAQMLNYVNHRAMFEGWSAVMWRPASGLLLWMSHPAWPSCVWQLYSHDYDTHASYYGAKKACEPLHVQWSIADDTIAVVNRRASNLPEATLTVAVYGMDGALLKREERRGDFPFSATTDVMKLAWPAPAPGASPVQFLKLELRDRDKKLVSENFYWRAPRYQDQIALNDMPAVKLTGKVVAGRAGEEAFADVELTNASAHVALMTHLILRDAATGGRILPAYYTDNYVSLLPGEVRTIRIQAPGNKGIGLRVDVEGWNITPQTLTP